ncbi:MAG TPA: hypothetical protein PKA27_07855 [Fimbriimonadaceae bacterium]|nr:hypothetical protein [Fimbriimonadaceae bacterium]
MRWIDKGVIVFVLKCILATCVLGVALDLVTANVAVEYFTVHHPKVVESESPWVMAFVWGIGASWWFGLIAGVILVWANLRRHDPVSWNRVVRMVGKACIGMWVFFMVVLGSIYAIGGLVPQDKRPSTFEHDRRLMAVAVTHMTEYAVGGLVAIALALKTYRLRE